MVLSSSKPHDGGLVAPDFTLLEPLTGDSVSLADVRGEKGLLVAFICNHCPFVVHLSAGLKDAGRHAKSLGIGMVGISSNDATTYPNDAPDKMAEFARTKWPTFKYLYDESQSVAKDYDAVCTPDFFLFDKNMRLFYR